VDDSSERVHRARPLADIDEALAWAMVESSPDGMIVVDDGGVMLMVNRQVETLLGYDRAELLGKEIEELLPDRYRAVHAVDRLAYLDDPRSRPMGTGLELRALCKDGTELPVEVSLSPLISDEATMVIVTVRDITERRAASARAHLIQRTIDAAHEGVLMFDPGDLRFTYVNRGASDQLGYGQDELLTMTLVRIGPELTEAELRQLLEPLLRGEIPSLTLTTVLRRRSGVDVPVEIVIEHSEPSSVSEPGSMIAVVRDITERRRAEGERERHRAWLEALAEIRSLQLEQGPIQHVLEQVCHHTRRLVGASDVFVISPSKEGEMAAVTTAAGDHRDLLVPVEIPLAGSALGQALTVAEDDGPEPDLPDPASAVGGELRQHLGPLGLGPVAGATLRGGDGEVLGVLIAARAAGADVFEDVDQALVTTFAHEAGTAISLARARASAAHLSLLEDRERIAHDLHDMVIQRLFATGMSLQSLSTLVPDPETRSRLDEAVDELDQTIAEIRGAIFRLSQPATTDVLGRIQVVVDAAAPALGFRPELHIEGDLQAIAVTIVDELVPALTEALSNVARHAGAASTRVSIAARDDGVALEVTDDGVGVDLAATRGHGLDNLAHRAHRLGGSFTYFTNDDGGTTLSWVVRGRNP
jgi:PAS domain S-box-containing protein